MKPTEHDFLKFVADILDVSFESIDMDTCRDEFSQWDSLGHLRLIMEVQEAYGAQIPLVDFAAIKTFRDLYERI
ncbi:MAG: acyl carrier protein [Kiritimatiellae bacterium]|nr:acyl carrier protein [Kiritimatiellia bacterium]